MSVRHLDRLFELGPDVTMTRLKAHEALQLERFGN
jgi:hypothetical protein